MSLQEKLPKLPSVTSSYYNVSQVASPYDQGANNPIEIHRGFLAEKLRHNWNNKKRCSSIEDLDDSLTNLTWLHANPPVQQPVSVVTEDGVDDTEYACSITNDSHSNKMINNNPNYTNSSSSPSIPTEWPFPVDQLTTGGNDGFNLPARAEYRINPALKPPFSYATMICMAMRELGKSKIALSDIYSWMSDNFMYYKVSNSSWQNSVRHNLSLNKCFEKVPRRKDEPGKGGFWRVNHKYLHILENGISKRRRIFPHVHSTSSAFINYSYDPNHQQQQQQQLQQQKSSSSSASSMQTSTTNGNGCDSLPQLQQLQQQRVGGFQNFKTHHHHFHHTNIHMRYDRNNADDDDDDDNVVNEEEEQESDLIQLPAVVSHHHHHQQHQQQQPNHHNINNSSFHSLPPASSVFHRESSSSTLLPSTTTTTTTASSLSSSTTSSSLLLQKNNLTFYSNEMQSLIKIPAPNWPSNQQQKILRLNNEPIVPVRITFTTINDNGRVETQMRSFHTEERRPTPAPTPPSLSSTTITTTATTTTPPQLPSSLLLSPPPPSVEQIQPSNTINVINNNNNNSITTTSTIMERKHKNLFDDHHDFLWRDSFHHQDFTSMFHDIDIVDTENNQHQQQQQQQLLQINNNSLSFTERNFNNPQSPGFLLLSSASPDTLEMDDLRDMDFFSVFDSPCVSHGGSHCSSDDLLR